MGAGAGICKEDNRRGVEMEWKPIENVISLEQLLARWRGVTVDGTELDFSTIDQFVRGTRLTAYDRKDWIISGGHKEWRGQQRPALLGLNGCESSGQDDVIFDMEEVYKVEKEFAVSLQKSPLEKESELKKVGDKFVFTEHQLIKKEDLYKRWTGATDEEIAAHVENGELGAFRYYKGPINGIVWCTFGTVYYRDQVDWSNPDLYDYNDQYCDFFLLEDVERCEAEHPEYIGNVTPESLGLVQPDDLKEPEEEPEYICALDAAKILKKSPVKFVQILWDNSDALPLVGMGFSFFPNDRQFFYSCEIEEAAEKLDRLGIHRLDWEEYLRVYSQDLEAVPSRTPEGNLDFSAVLKPSYVDLEAQLADALKKLENFESLRQWSARLEEQIQSLRGELAAKDARIYGPKLASSFSTIAPSH